MSWNPPSAARNVALAMAPPVIWFQAASFASADGMAASAEAACRSPASVRSRSSSC